MASSQSPLIGIDLGTTNSLCAVFEDGMPRLIPNATGSELTPSVVGLLESGEVVVGETARQLGLTQPDRAIATFKRWMGEGRKVKVGDQEFTAPELSALVLESLKADAEAHLGCEAVEAVITVPAYFNEHQRRATRRAGELAGLKVRRVLNEPTAAALCYGHGRGDEDGLLLVFDLGGGTFDVTVMEIFEGTLEILSTAGESRLGGEDFTESLLGWALSKMDRHLEQAEMTEPLLVSRLASEAENAKRALQHSESATLRLPDSEGNVGPEAATLKLSAAEFEERCTPLLERLRRPLERALRDAGKSRDAIDEILLVGGATRMPVVRRLVADFFERAPRTDVDPDRVVALGAAVQAALILDDKGVEDLIMTDVCPFTLGIEIVKQFGNRQVDGYYMPILHRNTTIPVSTEEYVGTTRDNQNQVLIGVYQGEGRRIEENVKLGELHVTGIPAGKAGQRVAVRFTYDLNGLLEVEAYLPKTGAKFQTVLKGGAEGMSEKELAAAVKRMQALKYYPREDLANQQLLLFGEGALKELDRYSRPGLETALDDFETALDSGNRDLYAEAHQNLLIALSAAGFPPPEDLSNDA